MELSDLLTDIFRHHAERTALRTAGRAWTYAELDRLTNALADRIDRECPPGRRVLVVGEHSAEAVVWALAAMRSGAVHTPMSPGLPVDRFEESVRVAQAGLVVCFDRESLVRADKAGVPALYAGDVGWPTEASARRPSGPRVAYSIFTSGSTGSPKLVDVGHGGLLNLCRSLRRLLDIAPGEQVLQFASLSFDASISEILGTLYAGATLVVPVRDQASWLGSVSRHLAEHGCDLAMLSPSVYARLDDTARRRIRKIEFCGEALGEAEFQRAIPHSRVFNAYGPTEATVCFSLAELTSFAPVIGTPIDGFRALVHDPETGGHATSGTGELVIVGDGVALGYVGGRAEEHRAFRTFDGERAYYTGDRVTLSDGTLSYLGRIDEQVKRLGHRVNLAHVESSLSVRLDREVALVRLGDEIVLVTTADGATEEALMGQVRSWLPVWEAPDRIVFVDTLPLATSGKLDKNALRESLSARIGATSATDAELRQVRDVVTAVLGREIDPDTSIFDAGGSSLAMIQIQVKLSQIYGEQAVEAAFAAMDYDFVVVDFLQHLHGEEVDHRESPVEAVFRQVEADLATLRAELPLLARRRATRAPDPAGETVLLTGVSGFIGGHVLDRVLPTRRPVLVVSTTGSARVLAEHRARFGRDMADYDPVRVIGYDELERWVDQRQGPTLSRVVHCGYQVNHLLPLDSQMAGSVRSTVLVVRAAAAFGARSFAFLSAASAGEHFVPLSAAALAAVADPYSRSKLVCEGYVSALTDVGCTVAHYRAGLVYGHQDGDRGYLKDDWFTGLIELARRLRAMPRLDGYVPVCDVRELSRTLLTGVDGGGSGSAVVVHRTYELAELLHHAGLSPTEVLPPAEWFDLARSSGQAHLPLLAAMQSALGGRGWRTPHREVDHDILGQLLGTPREAPRAVARS
ncbi:AMP-binding protein [Micromonospora sp. NPDC051925]|uniref:AMP-binding protein n=1 Tax=Micromonospora sp. NPDC051925 TaxID=3364288 RepID=UPI0037C84F24